MKLPLSLIREFIEIDLDPSKIAQLLTLSGIEVDKIDNEIPSFSNVICAEVEKVERHPSADKLVLAKVFDGKSHYSIVCGAPNCKKGLRIALAKIGAHLTDKDGKKWEIKKAKLRGVESEGMLCSLEELGGEEKSEGILELPMEIPLGNDLSPLFCDPVFHLSFTPNLGHAMSALGIARELSALLNKPLKFPESSFQESTASQTIEISIEDPIHCLRYTCQMACEVTVAPSPFWLERQLKACDLHPVNNIVDILNLVMVECGQPLHAFDYDQIEGKKIRIFSTKKEQKLLCLDGEERVLPPSCLVIGDAKKILAIAGIMGGKESAISSSTSRILIESAFFDPMIIRKSSKALALRTDSALRFEKGVDPEGLLFALKRTLFLLQKIGGVKTIIKGTFDQKQKEFAPLAIPIRLFRIQDLLGVSLSHNEVDALFRRLGFAVSSESEGTFIVKVPPYRFDLIKEIDLIEEIARVYGYNQIERRKPSFPSSPIGHAPIFVFEKMLRERLVAEGLQEMISCDLISPDLFQRTFKNHYPKEALLEVLHSKSLEHSILRPSLLPGLLQIVKFNHDHKVFDLAAFEVGRIYFRNLSDSSSQKKADLENLVEQATVSLIFSGKNRPHHWEKKPHNFDFFDGKGLLENLFISLKLPSFECKTSRHPLFHPSRQAELFVEQGKVGFLGEVHPLLVEDFGIKERVLFAELNTSSLLSLQKKELLFHEIPAFPGSERDWTQTLEENLPIHSLLQAVRKAKSPLLEKVELWDLYRNPQTPGKKNVTLRFFFRDKTKTLSYEEVEKAYQELLEKVSKVLQYL